MAGANGRVDQDTWDKLLEAYRADPGNHSNAARHALVQRRTAKRAWDHGAPGKPWGTKPISQLIAEDVELARSKVQLDQERLELSDDQAAFEADRERELARQAAVKATKEEAVLVAATRGAALNAMVSALQATAGLKAIMTRIGKEFEDIAAGGPMTRKEIMDVSQVARRYATTLRDITSAGQMALEMERLRLGEPTQIIGVETELDTMPLQELVKLAGYQDSVLQRAAERGLIVLEGGKGKKPA